MKLRTSGLSLPVTAPTAPGTYRLTVTLHDADGVAYDNATQAMLPTLIVRVTGAFDGAVLAAPTMTLTAGTEVQIPVRVANLGTSYWGVAAVVDPTGGTTGRPATYATVVGWWLPSGERVQTTGLPPAIAPGSTVDATVTVVVPRHPGRPHAAPGPVHARRAVPDGRGRRADPHPRHVGGAALVPGDQDAAASRASTRSFARYADAPL